MAEKYSRAFAAAGPEEGDAVKIVITGILFLLLSFSTLCGENAEQLLDEIELAVEGEFYSKAILLLDKGGALYPGDSRFPLAEGALYSERKLYNLALEAYEKAEILDPGSRSIRQEIASVLGFLNRNEEALVYLEDLAAEKSDYRLVDDLGWLYFKTHQPEKGIPLLEKSLEEEFHKSVSLTLGTLYSEVNNQELCRKYYLKAIETALNEGDNYFASVAYYNLALAEQSFYSYEKAIHYARESLSRMERSGGHLVLGDLYLLKGDYDKAAEEIRKAEPLDKTPLSAISLASYFRMTGELEAALHLAEGLKESKDDSWMYYYGIDSQQFSLDLNEIFRNIYKGLYQIEKVTPQRGFLPSLKRLFRTGTYYGKFRFYQAQYRILAFRVGRRQWERSAPLRGALTLASAAGDFPQTATKYLREARELESGLPLSIPWYDLEIGRETGDLSLIYRALGSFQKEWEARLIEDSYREILLSRNQDPSDSEGIRAVLAVYRQNPGGLRQYGLKLPVSLNVTGEDSRYLNRLLKRQLRSRGFILIPSPTGIEPVIRVHRPGAGDLQYSVTWPDGTSLASGREGVEKSLRTSVYRLGESLSSAFFP